MDGDGGQASDGAGRFLAEGDGLGDISALKGIEDAMEEIAHVDTGPMELQGAFQVDGCGDDAEGDDDEEDGTPERVERHGLEGDSEELERDSWRAASLAAGRPD